jgi:DNA-binding NarL/FixJ family response regulator
MSKSDPGLHQADRLTERQREVLVCIAKGMTNSEIAARLYLSQRSVEREIASARRALKAKNREVMLLLAFDRRVITSEDLKVHSESHMNDDHCDCAGGAKKLTDRQR